MTNTSLPPTVLCLLFLAFSAPAEAQQMSNEPRDFRGITWASAFELHRDTMMLLRREGDVAYYKKKGDGSNFGQAEAIKIAYRYYKEQFSAGVVQTYGPSNKKTLIESLHSQYGSPTKPYQRIEQYRWSGDQVEIVLTCEVTSYCAAEFISQAVSRLEAADTGELPSSVKKDDD